MNPTAEERARELIMAWANGIHAKPRLFDRELEVITGLVSEEIEAAEKAARDEMREPMPKDICKYGHPEACRIVSCRHCQAALLLGFPESGLSHCGQHDFDEHCSACADVREAVEECCQMLCESCARGIPFVNRSPDDPRFLLVQHNDPVGWKECRASRIREHFKELK